MSRGVIVAATLAAWAAIGAGAFQTFYLRIYAEDRTTMRASLTELPYRHIPGLRTLLAEADRRTEPGARILLALPHQPWQKGYGYGFRRAQYALQGKEVIPLLDRATDRVNPRAIERADWVLCWRACATPPQFEVVWRGEEGVLLRRAR